MGAVPVRAGAARAILRMEQKELAESSAISLETIKRLEKMKGEVSAYKGTVEAIRAALKKAGVEFLDAGGGGPGVRLREPGE